MRITLIGLLLFLLAACSGPPPQFTATAGLPATPQVPSPTSQPPSPTAQEPTAPPPPTETQTATVPAPTLTPAPTATLPSVTVLPDPAAYTWQPVASRLAAPLDLVSSGDGSGRLFILEQAGVVRILKNGTLLPTPFLDIRNKVKSGGERGLLGLAFHPRYSQNGYFYVNYTDREGNTVIARYNVSQDDPDRADPASEKRLLHVVQPYANHNGGMLAFGPDGYLYLGLGDGGSGGDPLGNGQSLQTLLGKILRIDVDHGDPYAIPPDNPFANGGGLPEIWAYGLRNPWRFSFDRVTGDLYIGDVGQNQWEEIDFLPAGSPGGANFGWNYLEGTHPYGGNKLPNGLNPVAPVAEYSHSQGCSVTGGVIYRGKNLPEWQGVYLYGDYCSGRVWGLLRDAQGTWENSLLFENAGRISSFGADEQGEVYLVDLTGNIYRLAKK